ncbi:FAD/NAD(P)-binding domain-containing protein [Lactarius akahatsu]|uniref:FAD/NAD(P)-binding domain-containing protein n=1 Tax=Lactarius akahatsu TaxID=416441 RepID=A0AAD4LNJ2_9AGAM|nr:FAD/NAD(P)-binding domain-containing protein [Lactarius akahatsu]
MSSHHPPEHAQILIVGGGPSGSYAAASLALEGFHVVLLEATAFPRYHIGESLIPSVRHHLRFIGAEEKVASHGFFKKPGAAMKFNKYKKEAYTDFIALGHDNNAWNVTRSEFDKILLDHAESTGAHVFQSTRVMSLAFSGKRPTSALWTHGPSSQSGTITFDYLVDASGRAGLMSNRYLKNRHFNSSLKNVAMWAYWRNTGVYARGTTAEGSPYFEALSDESGWAWFIPLGENLTSVGIVRDQTAFNKSAQAHRSHSSQSSFSLSPVSPLITFRGASSTTSSADSLSLLSANPPSHGTPPSSPSSPTFPFSPGGSWFAPVGAEQRYLSALDLAPGVRQLRGPDGVMVRGESESDTVRTASDYSYSASYYAGENFRIVGDAGAFIDPFFSSGIHLAMTGGLSAAASIAASIRGDCPESEAAEWHSQRVGVSYTRFLIVVLSAYKQMRAQSKDVLCDIGEDNFDKAFSFLRPVIQGNADLGPRLSEIEVQNALDFCAGLFTPINTDAVKALGKHFESIDPDARLPPSSVPEKTLVEGTIAEAKQDTQRVSHPGRKRSGTIDTVRRWLGKVSGISEQCEEREPSIGCPPITPAAPERSPLLSRRRGTISSTISPLQVTGQSPTHNLPQRPATALLDVNAPLLPPIEIQNFARQAALLPPLEIGSASEETEAEMRRVLEKINARRVIHREHSGLHSLEEEALGAGYRVRLQRGRLGLVHVEAE